MEPEDQIETPAGVDAPEPSAAPDPKPPEPTAVDAVNAALEAEAPKPKPADDDKDEEGEAPAIVPRPEEKPAAKPEEAAKPDAAAKPPEVPAEPEVLDPINDPIPVQVKGKTRERMTSLISTVKEVSTERDRYLGERDEIVGMIQSTGSSPEQYGEALDYLRAVNSGDPAQIRVAIKKVQAELHALASMIGEPVPGVDLVAGHADLKAALEAGELSPAVAQELAAARALRTSQAHQGQRATEQTQATRAIDAGKASLNKLEVQLQTDPQYQQKRALLIPVLQPILAQLPPAQWASAFRQAYDRLQVPAAPAAAARPAAPQGQPLRARQPAGGPTKAPTSMLDAISEGIEQASRR